jgi:hypothetical protein
MAAIAPEIVREASRSPIKSGSSELKDQEIIDGNSWGFSVYDPKTGITQYYTSNGRLLGQR